MGLFDLPAPLFNVLDGAMATVLPAAARLAIWAVFGAVLTMFLYKLCSPQAKIGQAKREAKAARQRLNAFDGDFADAGPLIKNQFTTAFKHVGMVVPGTLPGGPDKPSLYCAVIVKTVDEQTRAKTSINDLLRD